MELSCRDLLSLLPCKCATYINTNGAPGYHLAKRFHHLPSVFLQPVDQVVFHSVTKSLISV